MSGAKLASAADCTPATDDARSTHLPLELAASRFVVAARSQLHGHRRQAGDIEPGVDLHRPVEAAHEEAGDDEGDERESHLRQHERVAQAEHPIAATGIGAAFLDFVDEARPRCPQRRGEAEEQAGDQRRRRGERRALASR